MFNMARSARFLLAAIPAMFLLGSCGGDSGSVTSSATGGGTSGIGDPPARANWRNRDWQHLGSGSIFPGIDLRRAVRRPANRHRSRDVQTYPDRQGTLLEN